MKPRDCSVASGRLMCDGLNRDNETELGLERAVRPGFVEKMWSCYLRRKNTAIFSSRFVPSSGAASL